MPLETGEKIEDLNPLWPLGTDVKSEGDDHLRLIKDVLQKDALPFAALENVFNDPANVGSWQIVAGVLTAWGQTFTADPTAHVITFPQVFLRFPTVVLTPFSGAVISLSAHVTDVQVNQCTIATLQSPNTPVSTTCYWYAAGEWPG